VAKLPHPPGVEAIKGVPQAVARLAAGTKLARIYFAGGPHPTSWNEFRHWGPLRTARFDHHLTLANGEPYDQDRSILYCATLALTCLAELFQDTRRINRARKAPWLVIFELQRELKLLDISGSYATRAGASMAIASGNRARARGWARDFYDAHPGLDGLQYCSSMHANESAIALTDRAEASGVLPEYPLFNRALSDDSLLGLLKYAAVDLGYALI
jgi:hypothetical protein